MKSFHLYEVRPRKDRRGFDLISDALPFGRLMSAYLSYLYRSGEKRVYGQIVTFESRRGEKMFERYGFKGFGRFI